MLRWVPPMRTDDVDDNHRRVCTTRLLTQLSHKKFTGGSNKLHWKKRGLHDAMVGAKPLKLISKRLSRPTQLGGQQTLPVKSWRPVNKNWLWPTTHLNGMIKDAYRPTLHALAGLYEHTAELKEVRRALMANQVEQAESQWHELLSRADMHSESKINSWKELSRLSPSGTYGPPVFKNVLESIKDLQSTNVSALRRILTPKSRSTDIYVVPAVLESIAKHDSDLAIDILSRADWDPESRRFGLNALLYAVEMEPSVIIKALRVVPLPARFQLQPDLERRLCNHTSDMACIDALEAMVAAELDISSPTMDKVLRRVFSYSDRGADMVLNAVPRAAYPITIYPFVIRHLCSRVAAGSDHARFLLDQCFNDVLPRLAEVRPNIVLHLLVMRIIATDGVQATAPVLDRWIALDPKGVSEPTWLLLFQAFRRLGRPDKCTEVLTRTLATYTRLSAPFVGEYLAYVAQFYNLHIYLDSLRKVVPAISPVLAMLDITKHEKRLSQTTESTYLQALRVRLGPENRSFKVDNIHESWLNVTYQAVLATVDDEQHALHLYKRYAKYVLYSKSPTSLRVVDQFVELLASMRNGLDAAEWLYRDALKRLYIKRPTDGANNSRSLDTLCYKLVKANQFERAVKLVNDALAHDNVVVRGSALRPVIDAAPVQIRGRLIDWAHGIGARMAPIDQGI